MIPFRKSLAFRLLLVSFILLALPLLVDSFVLIRESYQDAIANAKGYLVDVAHYRELPLSHIQPVKRPLFVIMREYLGLNDQFPQESTEETGTKLHHMTEAGGFFGIFLIKITDDNTLVVVDASDPKSIGQDYTEFFSDLDFLAENIYKRGYFTVLSYDKETLQPYFLVGSIVYDQEGKPDGMMLISTDITSRLEALLAPDTERYPVYFGLMLPNTLIFAATDPSLQYQHFTPLDGDYNNLFLEKDSSIHELLPDPSLKMSHAIGYPFLEFTWKGEDRIGYIQSLQEGDISLLVYAKKSDIFTQPLINFIDIYGIYALILVVGGGMVFLMTRRMARPMTHLSSVMEGIQKGELTLRYHPDRFGFEINTLGTIFNEMIDHLLQNKRMAEEDRVKRETYAQELRIGQQVQRSLLPTQMPKYSGVSLAAAYLPAKEVGGDFYDVMVRNFEGKEQLVLSIADASGKGVQACFFSLGVRSMLRTYSNAIRDVGEILVKTAALFYLDSGDTGMFVTALMGIYDHETHLLHYYSCGHNPPLVRRANGKTELLDHLGISLGLHEKLEATEKEVELSKGDMVIFYTDGITEAHNAQNMLFSEGRLEAFLAGLESPGAQELVDGLIQEVGNFVGKAPQHDDITLLVLKVEE